MASDISGGYRQRRSLNHLTRCVASQGDKQQARLSFCQRSRGTCRRSIELSCSGSLEMSGSKEGLDIDERARYEGWGGRCRLSIILSCLPSLFKEETQRSSYKAFEFCRSFHPADCRWLAAGRSFVYSNRIRYGPMLIGGAFWTPTLLPHFAR
jgi:hypothetical protein